MYPRDVAPHAGIFVEHRIAALRRQGLSVVPVALSPQKNYAPLTTRTPRGVQWHHVGANRTPRERVSISPHMMPLKLFESLACGVPVVVSDYPGIADTVRAVGCGLVVAPGNPRELAQAVSRIWSSPDASGERGRAWVEVEHSWKARAKETRQVCDVVSGGTESG